MQPLCAEAVLDLWDTGQNLHPLDRAVLLAAAAQPARSWNDVADLPLGQRDAFILMLRRATLGDSLGATTSCPLCQDTCELTVSVHSLLEQATPSGQLAGNEKCYRLPTSRDLASVLSSTDAAPESVLARCCGAEDDDGTMDVLNAWIARFDPLAEIQLALACPACAHEWIEILDPAAFFWREIEARAARLLSEVDCLARAYGWSEAQVLQLSDRRRAAYLERLT